MIYCQLSCICKCLNQIYIAYDNNLYMSFIRRFKYDKNVENFCSVNYCKNFVWNYCEYHVVFADINISMEQKHSHTVCPTVYLFTFAFTFY